ncbi:hypothetical protein [Pseudarthrobacter sp. PvP090]|uniref:hypothetical protein n=1 Tax=Pseudarthrobacter sp. PvP090 TaxID=3156393 RepID=UPI0033918CF5
MAGTKRHKLRPLIVVSSVAVLVVIMVLAFFLRPDAAGDATATPAPSASSDPASAAALPPAPAVTYYEQQGPPAGSPLEAVEPLQIGVSAAKTGASLPDGIVGLSLESTDLADANLRGDNPEIVSVLKGLGKPLLRFGGSSVDRRMFWTSTGEPVPAGYKGDRPRPVKAVSPADLERINGLLTAADATISLTVDLGHYNPARAADLAKHATRIFGARLVSITVGNEPNGFPTSSVRAKSWKIGNFMEELNEYATAIHAVAPDLPLLGPGAYTETWWEPFAEAKLPQQKILSLHHYPLSSCDAKDPQSTPTMANLMSARMHDRTIEYQQAALSVGKKAGLDVWIPETGISACDGANPTTTTHASAMWSTDYVLSAAQQGIQRLGFHSSLITCKGGPPMSPICSGGAYLRPDGTLFEEAPYFGLSLAAGLSGGSFLKLDQSGGGLVYSYALQQADGSTSVVIVNENDPEKSAPTQVSLELPGRPLTGTMTQMTGPSYSAQDSTLVDGAKAPARPVAERPTVPGFAYGSETQKFQLTAGTVTVLNFTY